MREWVRLVQREANERWDGSRRDEMRIEMGSIVVRPLDGTLGLWSRGFDRDGVPIEDAASFA